MAASFEAHRFAMLLLWARVEGGYIIAIKAVEADGKLDASYANPNLQGLVPTFHRNDCDAGQQNQLVGWFQQLLVVQLEYCTYCCP